MVGYYYVPTSWGRVWALAFWLALWACAAGVAVNVIGHLVPVQREGRVCWLDKDYTWPLDGWAGLEVCVETKAR